MRTALLIGFAAQIAVAARSAVAQTTGQSPAGVPLAPAYGRGGVAVAELVAGLGNTMRVLMIGAHPDDEDTRLLAWLARGQHVDAAYLSLTRGDGGQNLIGNELGEALGVIRTEELLAARRIDGAHQYFTRAYDFGFSKTAAESYSHWPHDSLLGDVVTIIRAFRPHVIIAVFSGTPRDGHGQHQVSGLLAREAYDASGDTVRFPVKRYGDAWAADKFYRDRSYFGAGDNSLAINVGAFDPLLGVTYSEIAAASRSQHKSQGFGNIGSSGPATAFLFREASRVNTAVAPGQERSMFDGIDTTWKRFSRTAVDGATRSAIDSVRVMLGRINSQFKASAPGAELGALAQLWKQEFVVFYNGGAVIQDEADFDTVAPRAKVGTAVSARHESRDAGQLDMETTVRACMDRVERASSLASGVDYHATVASDVAPIGAVGAPVVTALTNHGPAPLRPGIVTWLTPTANASLRIPAGRPPTALDSAWRDTVVAHSTAVTQPWWLVEPRNGDLFTVPASGTAEDERLDGTEALVGAGTSSSAGVPLTLRFRSPVMQRIADPRRGEVDRPLAFVLPLSLTLDRTVEYVPAGTPVDRSIQVLVRSGVDSASDVTVSLQMPRGMQADSISRHVTVPARGTRRVDFRITGALPPGEDTLRARVESNGATFTEGYVPIEYDHIRPQKLYRPAELTLSVADIKVPPGLTVAYIAGVGDNVEPMLEQLGLHVTVLDPASLPTTDLSRYTTIVVGPRAYEASADLVTNNGRLLDFAKSGGTLVVQYGQYEMAGSSIMPYPITLGRPADRVTDENAPVRMLDPASPLLAAPNKVTGADFAGWVQERSLYMPHTFDPHYHAVLAMNDPDEPSNDGAILVAPVGKGTYVYTTLSFFRQLPAGLPGAARLFVNLLEAGRRCCDAM
jgi:LmbE family N-acetylglucosaminyl deacetylase